MQYDDSNFSFGYGRNTHGDVSKDAMLAFFGARYFAPSIAGTGGRELAVTGDAMRQIDSDQALRAIVQLLRNDFRMFSVRSASTAALEQLATVFLEEIGQCSTYSNTHIYPASHEGECLGPFTPVTRSTVDTLICAVSKDCVAYWVYSDDE